MAYTWIAILRGNIFITSVRPVPYVFCAGYIPSSGLMVTFVAGSWWIGFSASQWEGHSPCGRPPSCCTPARLPQTRPGCPLSAGPAWSPTVGAHWWTLTDDLEAEVEGKTVAVNTFWKIKSWKGNYCLNSVQIHVVFMKIKYNSIFLVKKYSDPGWKLKNRIFYGSSRIQFA